MVGHWRNVSASALLLIVLVSVVALAFALIGGVVFIPLGGVVFWVAIGLLVFIGAQLLLFRAAGLRSDADRTDDEPGTPPAESDAEHTEADWRAWRG